MEKLEDSWEQKHDSTVKREDCIYKIIATHQTFICKHKTLCFNHFRTNTQEAVDVDSGISREDY